MKRKPKQPCPNPLFLMWLEEWYQEAKSRGVKSEHSFRKAINSLKNYPLPLRSGKEACILEGIGASTGKRLDEALAAYYEDNPDAMSLSSGCSAVPGSVPVPPPAPSGSQSPPQPTAKKSRGGGGREYVPAYRSGAYALIVTLYKATKVQSYCGYMNKEPLQRQAQPLSETSFTMPDPGSHYTAWSSMGTLIKKGLVIKTNNPARYSITDAGCALALRLEQANKSGDGSSTAASTKTSNDKPAKKPRKNNTNTKKQKAAEADVPQLPTLEERVQHHLPYDSDREKNLFNTGSVTTYPRTFQTGASSSGSLFSGSASSHDPTPTPASSITTSRAFLNDLHSQGSSTDEFLDLTQSSDDEDENFPEIIPQRTWEDNINKPSAYGLQLAEDFSQNEPSFTPEFILRPGTFDIILCVDVVETTGGGSSARKEVLLKELNNNGVQCVVRKLNLGDFLWIAKQRLSSRDDTSKELVLDHIVERKRMDDLASSIMDGRFKEQKFRLRNCGLKRPIYLVEEFGSSKNLSISYQTLQQAIVNTQVSDDFFIKQTADTKESALYLTLLTRHLQKLYVGKTLGCCPKAKTAEVDNSSSSSRWYYMKFQEFQETTEKNRELTVSELFVKQLMQIGGMSADRAIAIVEKYPTPSRLLRAYDEPVTEKEKEQMLAQIKCGKNQRNLGQALSTHVYLLYYGVKGSLLS